MEIILLENVSSLGSAGDKVTVKNGYARNYLIPFGKASIVTEESLARISAIKAENKAKEDKVRDLAETKAKEMSAALDSPLVIKVKANEDKLFGSVSAKDIIDALAVKGIAIDKNQLHNFDAIRNLGDYKISVKLHSEVMLDFDLTVEKA